jgi:hypothetical protein
VTITPTTPDSAAPEPTTDADVWQPVPVKDLFPDNLNYNRRTTEGKRNFAAREAYRMAIEALTRSRAQHARAAAVAIETQEVNDELTKENDTLTKANEDLAKELDDEKKLAAYHLDRYQKVRKLLNELTATIPAICALVRRTGLEATAFQRWPLNLGEEMEKGTKLEFKLGEFRIELHSRSCSIGISLPGTMGSQYFEYDSDDFENNSEGLPTITLLALEALINIAHGVASGDKKIAASLPIAVAKRLFPNITF